MRGAGTRPFASSWRRERLTVEERVARGRAARATAPRSSHGLWEPAADRADPVELLEQQGQDRLPQLLPVRYGRMLESPFSFYRGAAAIMAMDLVHTPRSGVTVQLCGDAHLSNFGFYASPERRMVFDINDFDETLPGPWEWDVKRMATSFEVLGRGQGFARVDRHRMVLAGVREYRAGMIHAAGLGGLDAWYQHLEIGELLSMVREEQRRNNIGKRDRRTVTRAVSKARTRDSARVLAKRTDVVDGEPRITADPPLILPIEDIAQSGTEWEDPAPGIKRLLSSYKRTLAPHHHPLEEYQYVHSALKVVGVGSVGTRCYLLLLSGRDKDDPLFLQVKEAQRSVLEPFLGPSGYRHHGQRVVVGQRVLQAATDIFLGWQRIRGVDGVTRDYYVRQFHDWKGSPDVESFRVRGATLYARLCGATLARGHARWGDRVAVAAYLGNREHFDRAIAEFARRYADQNERDFAAFGAAVESGRIPVEVGL